MIQGHHFEGYQIRETIHQGTKSVVYRALRKSDGRSVILKLPAEERPGRRRVAELKHEHAITAQLPIAGVSQVLAIEEGGGQIGLVMEDVGGTSLREYLDRRGKLSPAEVIDIAL